MTSNNDGLEGLSDSDRQKRQSDDARDRMHDRSLGVQSQNPMVHHS